MPRRCFPMDKPDYERITELVKQYHRKGHVTTAWWEEMWSWQASRARCSGHAPRHSGRLCGGAVSAPHRHHQTAAVQCPGERDLSGI
jgi:hypothetical protein